MHCEAVGFRLIIRKGDQDALRVNFQKLVHDPQDPLFPFGRLLRPDQDKLFHLFHQAFLLPTSIYR